MDQNDIGKQMGITGNDTSKDSSKGPAIGIVIIILVIVLGGLYIFTARERDNMILENEGDNELLNQSNSTELGSIEADATATNLDNLTPELDDIESELNTDLNNSAL